MPVEFKRATLADCPQASGIVAVIDVLRAFSTAAYALAAGAEEILLAGTVEEALALRERFPGSLVMGEMWGHAVPGFDFSNSPAQFDSADLRGRRLTQRTSAGTQGVVLSRQADYLLAASFVCARATVRYIRQLPDLPITLVVTGADSDETFKHTPIPAGDEDAACADYLEALLLGQDPDPAPYLKRVLDSPTAGKFTGPLQSSFPAADLSYCARANIFEFALPIQRVADLLAIRRPANQ